VRGRFAPSPTGYLHLGNARTALLSWLQVRAAGGKFLLRVEDLDTGRCRQDYVDSLFRDLEYLGLTFDEAPVFQSQRGAQYEEALSTLREKGLVYPCLCSRAEIARMASAPHGPFDDGPRYPGTCRRRTPDEVNARAQQRAKAYRFLAPSSPLGFVDGLFGPLSSNVQEDTGDFVVFRQGQGASYQLAVVVDDAASGISHVLRGEDLLSSTARQLALYQALEKKAPDFVHVPLVLGENRQRMAKRHGASSVKGLREAGVPAEKVLGLLAFWSGLSDGQPVSARELIGVFALEKVSKQAPVAHERELDALLRGDRTNL
jgi:glutamyl-tRNA synthetase